MDDSSQEVPGRLELVGRRHGFRRFRGVCKTLEDKVKQVLIGQAVEDVLSIAPASDGVVDAEKAKALQDYSGGLTLGGTSSLFATNISTHAQLCKCQQLLLIIL
jgi:alpha-L-fucosidase